MTSSPCGEAKKAVQTAGPPPKLIPLALSADEGGGQCGKGEDAQTIVGPSSQAFPDVCKTASVLFEEALHVAHCPHAGMQSPCR